LTGPTGRGTIVGVPEPFLTEPTTREHAMRIRTGPGLAAIGLALTLISAPARIRAAEEGFKPLFNGKDLSGWLTPDVPGLFHVENGEIVGQCDGKIPKNEFLVTDTSFSDFTLKAKVKFTSGNSGIQFRSKRAPNGAVTGPQADVANGYWGSIYGEGTGMIEAYPKDKGAQLVKQGDWNEFVITAKGDHVTMDLNGTRVIDRTDPRFGKSGIIALQVHKGQVTEVRFKDIEIKPLD
jgi:hypothetical protein